ncbi:MAG: two-component regulator propeller domain-containing protein [Thiotrichaceae bacterium]|nr:two-component regulator propeller domain-containing protein [Thiotrichaceae bacterium]
MFCLKKQFLIFLGLFYFSLSHAAELTISPANPIVEINKTINLSVAGAVGDVFWSATKGTIRGEGTQVVYIAPEKIGFYIITVSDSEGNYGTTEVVITPPNDFSLENAQWEVFTNRSQINALLLSEDGNTLWVGTRGGLEKWNIKTQKLQQILTRLDGLPSSNITALLTDDRNIWVGTDAGLAYLNNTGRFEIKQINNSLEQLKTSITVLFKDKQTHLWVGTKIGLIKYDNNGQWFDAYPELLTPEITAISEDRLNRLWVSSYYYSCYDVDNDGFCEEETKNSALSYLTESSEWITYTQANSILPNVHINSILVDEQNGLWLQTMGENLISISSQAQWALYSTESEELPNTYLQTLLQYQRAYPWVDNSGLINLANSTFERNNVGLLNSNFNDLIADKKDGLWLIGQDKIIHLNQKNEQLIYHKKRHSYLENEVIADGIGGLWFKGTEGLVHINNQDDMQVYNGQNSKLPYHQDIKILYNDTQGGLWINLEEDSLLAHLSHQGKFTDYSEISHSNDVFHEDKLDGVWLINQARGLRYLNNQGKLKIYSSTLPFYNVHTVHSDTQGGIWVGTYDMEYTEFKIENSDESIFLDEGSNLLQLAYLNSESQWTSYSKSISPYPDEISLNRTDIAIESIYDDGSNGIWVITNDSYHDFHIQYDRNSLIHLNEQRQWKIYNEELDEKNFNMTLVDKQGNLWISLTEEQEGGASYRYAGKGLAFLNNEGQVVIYTKENSDLPDNYVLMLTGDRQNGVWFVTTNSPYGLGSFNTETEGKGVAHIDMQGNLTIYTKENGILPSNSISALLTDETGGLWIGNSEANELAHLTFGRKNELCTQDEIKADTCQTIQQGNALAIIVAAGGAQTKNSLWDSTESISNRIYQIFYRRGFNKSQIYYLSPKTWADFNGDGFNDRINRLTEDRHLSFADLQAAFEWAKGFGELNQPLYFFFMDHGGENKLQLSPTENITSEQLNALFDDYQNTTNNQMIALIEACHSGSFLQPLAAPNRAVIASAKADEKAYFFDKKGFSRFFADYLLKGTSFEEAFTLAGRDQDKLRSKNFDFIVAGEGQSTQQTPQFDDNQDGIYNIGTDGKWLKQVYINGNFQTADITLAVTNQTDNSTFNAKQAIPLQAKATLAQGQIERVWAVIRPPKMDYVLDTSGTPIVAFPRIELYQDAENSDIWQTTWDDAIYNGDYLITFYAQDNDNNIANSERDTTISIANGINPPQDATVQLAITQTAEHLSVEVLEELSWGYDLYIALIAPDGQYLTVTRKNAYSINNPLNKLKPWYSNHTQSEPMLVIDTPLDNFPLKAKGQYCIYAVLSPEQNDVIEAMGQNLTTFDMQCFEM